MKVPVIKTLLVALACVAPVSAIERPKSLESPSEGNGPEVLTSDEKAPEALPWLGIYGEPLDETLQQHLSLKSGIVLRYVASGSPAAAAGLLPHDIVLEFAGQPVDSQDTLRESVKNFVPGDEVTMSVMSKGETSERKVTLSERPAELNVGRLDDRTRLREGLLDLEKHPELREAFQGLENLFPKGRDGQNFGGDFQAQMEEMEERLEKLQDLPGMELKIEDLLRDLAKGKDLNMSLKSSSSVTLMDEKGSVEMKVNENGKEVIVRDLEGGVVFEGPWNTEEDRSQVDPDVASRIDMLNFDERANGIRLHFKNGSELLEFPETPLSE